VGEGKDLTPQGNGGFLVDPSSRFLLYSRITTGQAGGGLLLTKSGFFVDGAGER